MRPGRLRFEPSPGDEGDGPSGFSAMASAANISGCYY